jgi:hypothetical protein
MDVLSEVLKVVRLEGAFFFNAESNLARRVGLSRTRLAECFRYSGRLSDGIPDENGASDWEPRCFYPGATALRKSPRLSVMARKRHSTARSNANSIVLPPNSAAIAKRGLPVTCDRHAGAVYDHTCPR